MARSEWCAFLFCASNQAHGLPGSLKLGSQVCHTPLPTAGNTLAGLPQGGLPAALVRLSATLLFSSEGALEWVAVERFLSRASASGSA